MRSNVRRVRLLTLGGTIACVPTPAGLAPLLRAADLLASIDVPPGVAVDAVDFLERTILFPDDWLRLARAVVAGHDEVDAFVVTLGTDTLAHAAAALTVLIADLGRPVVLTGAMRPPGAADSDARRNLRDALTVARSGAPGVFVVFAGRVIDGARASKTRADALAAFESINAPRLGVVRGGHVRWNARPAPPNGPPELRDRLETRVGLLRLAPQLTPDDLAPLARHAGVVVEGYGDGNVPANLVEPLARMARERVLVLASQCPYGAVAHCYEGGAALLAAGALSAGDRTTELALVRLMWALAAAADRQDVARLFTA